MWQLIKTTLITVLGGFTDTDSFIRSITDPKQRRYVLTLAVKRLFTTISGEDILKQHETGQWMFQQKPISEQEKKLLIAEATAFINTKLWQVLQADIQYQANRMMFLLSENDDQITAGKLWLYTLDGFKTRLESITEQSAEFNTFNKPKQISKQIIK